MITSNAIIKIKGWEVSDNPFFGRYRHDTKIVDTFTCEKNEYDQAAPLGVEFSQTLDDGRVFDIKIDAGSFQFASNYSNPNREEGDRYTFICAIGVDVIIEVEMYVLNGEVEYLYLRYYDDKESFEEDEPTKVYTVNEFKLLEKAEVKQGFTYAFIIIDHEDDTVDIKDYGLISQDEFHKRFVTLREALEKGAIHAKRCDTEQEYKKSLNDLICMYVKGQMNLNYSKELTGDDGCAWNFIVIEDENEVVIHRHGYSTVNDVRDIMKQLVKDNEGSSLEIFICEDEAEYNEEMKKTMKSAMARGKRSVYAKAVK